MNLVTQKALPRRTFLRGLGVSLALPLLDGMVPALAATKTTAAGGVKRFGAFYVPHGVVMGAWTPSAVGKDFVLSPILQPLEPFRAQVSVLSGLCDKPAEPLPGEGVGDHPRASSTWLTGVRVKKSETDVRAGVSMDQLAVQVLGKETQLQSLELALDSVEVLGACDAGYSCAYVNTIAWRTPTTPLPMENNPRAVFERLFGETDSTDVATRLARLQEDRSILDFVRGEVAGLARTLGAGDQQKLAEYLEAVRDVERRIQTAEAQSARELPVVDQPIGIPATFEVHVKLMFDLLVLAYQTDLTRVATFMIGRELSGRSYPDIGVPEGHHTCSHHQNDPAKLAKLAKINAYHMQQFAYFLDKLRQIPDGDGSLLDHSLFIYGSGMSDGNIHSHVDLPTLMVGGGSGTHRHGQHVRYENDTPLANLYVAVLGKLGLPVENFGDSTGKLEALADL